MSDGHELIAAISPKHHNRPLVLPYSFRIGIVHTLTDDCEVCRDERKGLVGYLLCGQVCKAIMKLCPRPFWPQNCFCLP